MNDLVALVVSSVWVDAELTISAGALDGAAKPEDAARRERADTSKKAGRRRITKPFRERLTQVQRSENLIRLINDSLMPRGR